MKLVRQPERPVPKCNPPGEPRAFRARRTDHVAQLAHLELDRRQIARRGVRSPGRLGRKAVTECEVCDELGHLSRCDVVVVSQVDDREFLVRKLGHRGIDASRTTRELPAPKPAVLAGRRLSPRLRVVLLKGGNRIQVRAIPQERALSEELVKMFPARQTFVREVLIPAAEIFDACLQSASAYHIRSGPPQVPSIADVFVMADRALLDDSSRVFFEKAATHAERREDAVASPGAQAMLDL